MLEFRLPQFGMGMTDGTIIKWFKAEGERVSEGEILVEVEAAKTTVEVASPVSGVLASIVVPIDQNVPVQTVIAHIETGLADGSSLPAELQQPIGGVADDPATRPLATPLARRLAAAGGVNLTTLAGSGPRGRVLSRDVEAVVNPAAERQIEPRARRAAREMNIDLAMVVGSGPGGRVIERDVRRRQTPTLETATESKTARDSVSEPTAQFVDVPHTRMRRVIAERLSTSKQTVPHFYLVARCEIDELIRARTRINAAFPNARVSINDFLIMAMARALEMTPDANVSWTEAALRRFSDVDISMAVATDGGLLTPVIRQANRKSLRTIAAETRRLAERARAGQLMPAEYEGGSVSVSNLGMFAVEEFTAIINPPQACILAVGAGVEQPVARAGSLAVATVITCTLSVDHRAVDGAVAARLLGNFKKMIEDPIVLVS